MMCAFYAGAVRILSTHLFDLLYVGLSQTYLLCASTAQPLEIGGAIRVRMAKSKKNKSKPKINLTVREEQRRKLEQMAALEKRSVSNLIEVMADERWERLVEQQGISSAKTVAE